MTKFYLEKDTLNRTSKTKCLSPDNENTVIEFYAWNPCTFGGTEPTLQSYPSDRHMCPQYTYHREISTLYIVCVCVQTKVGRDEGLFNSYCMQKVDSPLYDELLYTNEENHSNKIKKNVNKQLITKGTYKLPLRMFHFFHIERDVIENYSGMSLFYIPRSNKIHCQMKSQMQ